MTLIATSVILSLIIGYVSKIYLQKFITSRDLPTKLKDMFANRLFVRFTVKTIISTSVFILYFILFDLSVLLSTHFLKTPDNRKLFNSQSILFLNYLKLIGKEPKEEAGPTLVITEDVRNENKNQIIEEDLEKQSKFLDNIGNLFNKTRSYISEKTQTQAVINSLDIIIKISKISAQEREMLVESIPEIEALKNNKLFEQMINDEHFLELMVSASQGSIEAIYKLGENKLIIEFMEDEKVKRLLKTISLKRISEQIDINFINSFRFEVPVKEISYQTFNHLTELDHHLKLIDNWLTKKPVNKNFIINTKDKYVLCSVFFKAKEDLNTLLKTDIDSKFYFFVNSKRIADLDNKKVINKIFKQGNYNLTYLIYKGFEPTLQFNLILKISRAK
ncbi:MAG: hypothetical protein COA79_20065 [Planctomycetota bacterium]|nr:MAG: hypothetical protein COA79_20065 [Planctomycetota bacterium]